MTKHPRHQIPAIYHRRIGDITVTAVSDGVLARTNEMMNNVSKEEGDRHLQAAFRDGFILSINAFLIHSGDRVALVETGSGEYLGPEAGKLLANIKTAGINPGDIDTILLTHMHPDHSAGLTDMKTGQANYENAELVVHENESKHWFDDAAMARGTEREKKLMFQQAREQCAPYRDRMRTFVGDDIELFPGVTTLQCHGHTPGHTGFMVQSGKDALLIWGDTVHMPEVQVPRPEVTMTVDVDPPAAEASRRRVFDRAAADRLLVTGMHLHFPGFGHVAKDVGGYRFVPEHWQQTL
jgi:glyoxylase-like metal-dependent hydrolase (beta-lactamase superfamily II)